MEERDIQKNIRLYTWFQILKEPLFWGPILILYIQEKCHMSLSEIYFMEAVAIAIIVILEIPSGALADKIGRKKTILLGSTICFLDLIIFSVANSPLMAWIGDVVFAIGYSFISGADESFLYETILEDKKWNALPESALKNYYTKIDGQAVAWRFLLTALASLPVGYLAKINLRIPLAISLIGVAINLFCVVIRMQEPQHFKKYNIKEHLTTMRNGIVFTFSHAKILWLIIFIALLTGVSKVWFFTYNPYFALVNIDKEYYGYIFSILNLVAFIFSRYAYLFEKHMNEYIGAIILTLCVGLPMFLMGNFIMPAMVWLVLCQNIFRGISRPYFGILFNRLVKDNNIRSTVLSVRYTFHGIAELLFLPLFGILFEKTQNNLGLCLQIFGLGCLAICFLLILARFLFNKRRS